MIKRLFISCYLVLQAFYLCAQKYGNEWINYNQSYFRINISSTGLYRIGYTTLLNSGIPVKSINPKNFQLYIKGEEQYIYLRGEADDSFDSNDYIEFYAQKNDGLFDSLSYHQITRHPNPYIPLFNDTNYAYLTWNSSLNNRRMTVETDLNFIGYTPSNYFYTEKIKAFNTHYSSGPTFMDVISDPRYLQTEGYGELINKGQFLQTNFGNLNVYQSLSLPVKLRVSYSGASATGIGGINYDHQLKIDFLDQSGNYKVINDTSFLGFRHFLVEKELVSSQLQNNSSIRVSSENNPLITKNNITNIHYIYLRYPQIPDLSNTSEHTFYIENHPTQLKTYLEIKNINIGGSQVILYDLTNHKYILTSETPNSIKVLIPNANLPKQCFLTTSVNVKPVDVLTPVNETGFFNEYNTQGINSPYLIITHKSLKNSANDYKTYRESTQGGAHQVIMADIDDLYGQFAYGNVKNPLAIKNFCRFLSDRFSLPPTYLLLIGKSIKHSMIINNPVNWTSCLVPTMGNPPSDNLLTSGIYGGSSSVPFIPIGRISAKNDAEVISYLNKVKTHESSLIQNPIKDWHKRVLHFSGGSDLSQQQTFANYLNDFGNIIKDTLVGARIFSFGKTTTAPIQTSVSDSIKRLIEYGASLITFFGHGSVTGFDQAIDDPSLYNNEGKYPLFIANSCYSGDIHLPGATSTSENFTLINKKGSIGFVASSSYGLINTLYNYSKGIYKSLSKESYYSGVGDAVKSSCENSSKDQLQEITNLEMTLEGDPSVKLNGFDKPDYEITHSSVYFNTSTYVDSIGINVIIKNNAKAIRDSFIVKIEHVFPTGDSAIYYKRFKVPFNIDTMHLFISKDVTKHIGLNRFRVFIDAWSEIDELSELNNTTGGYTDLMIPGGDAIPVFPYQYAIIPYTNQITLKASTIDPFAVATNYKLQLDTSDSFARPIQSILINSKGGVVKWTVNLPFKDSTVYFWRISKDSVASTDSYMWRESSFQVIGSKTGWSQAHFNQFKNDRYQYVNYIRDKRYFDFFNNKIGISCNNEYKSSNLYGIRYTLNNIIKSNYNFNTNDGWSVAVFDSISTEPWTSSVSGGYTFAQPYNNCLAFPNEKRASFDFGPSTFCGTNLAWTNDLQNFLNTVPINNYVLAYSSNTHRSSTFSSSLYEAFESFGGYSLRTVGDSVPVIVFGKKRKNPFVGCGQEVIGTSVNSKIVLTDTLVTKWNQGFIESDLIGPTTKWHSLHWNYSSQNNNSANDEIKLKIIGVKSNGMIDTLANYDKSDLNIYNLNNLIDARIYPKIKLIAFLSDNMFHLAPQLKKWQVIYDPIPECAINPQNQYLNNSISSSIIEGDDLIIHLPVENIGMTDFKDSIEFTYFIQDAHRIKHQLPSKLKPNSFSTDKILIDTIHFNTLNFSGLNQLWVDVNSPSNSRYQLEQYHFNNVAQIPFFVNRDKTNPLLDVTIDGMHILNGDIISSKPKILITLKDENKFLALNDTGAFTLAIKYPNQSINQRLNFSKDLIFVSAQLPDNTCRVEWHPELLMDGKYTLSIKATDRSKNVSGAIDYSIQFEVVNKQTITQVFNYPNPFSTSTKFVFTLTGSEVPDIFTIQIMTITGKVVKEITKDELGTIRVGRNVTNYEWDGKDEFGDKLANGVYLYKVMVRHNGKAVDMRTTEGDDFFRKGYGKMVIIR